MGLELSAVMAGMRQDELTLRQEFTDQYLRLLPDWPTFAALQDYPHTCLTKPRPFDQNLPNLSPGIEALQLRCCLLLQLFYILVLSYSEFVCLFSGLLTTSVS